MMKAKIYVVTGGSGSGKSDYAEELAVSFDSEDTVYLATMMPYGEEGRTRIERHRRRRAERPFRTVERFLDLKNLSLESPAGSRTILLECMSNLAANEMFDRNGSGKRAEEEILSGIEHLRTRCDQLVIVTNEIFSDGCRYDESIRNYLKLLGRINQYLVRESVKAVEIVYGIPVRIKEI